MTNSGEPKKPKIHLGKEVPSSPYVIDLRRAETPRPAERIRHPIEMPVIDPHFDLVPTPQDLAGQLRERDLTAGDHPLAFELRSKPLVEHLAEQWLGETPGEQTATAFALLELPEDEESTIPSRAETLWLRLKLPHGWQKAIAAFVGLSFLFVLPIHAMQQVEQARESKDAIASVSARAISNLSLGGTDLKNNDFGLAKNDFERATDNFTAAKENLEAVSGSIQAVLAAAPQTSATYNSLTALLSAGERISKSAALFASALSDIRQSPSVSTVGKLDILTIYLERMQPLLAEASKTLEKVDADTLPPEHQDHVKKVIATLPLLSGSVDEFLTFNQTLRTMLGGGEPMRYLVVFQNNAEIRPTGGFLGSFAEMTIDNGEIVDLQVPGGGTYDLQGSLDEFVAAPDPLQLVNARWEFQDGNWFPDFPESAKKLLWFYDHAGGPTVDGVLAVNATFVTNLISLLGPVDMPEYDRTITSENFLEETQKIVEIESDKSLHKPKQFLGDLAPKLLEKTTSADTLTFLSLLQNVGNGFTTRDIQLYLKDGELEKTIDDLGWSGRIAETTGDYLMLVNTNVGGGKTDLAIQEQVDLDVTVEEDGSIVNTATITRTHTGMKGDLFTGVNNVNYQRLYVPEGSELISASGDFAPPSTDLFESSDLALTVDSDLARTSGALTTDPESGTAINNEFDKTVFGNWTQTKPGTTTVTRYTYRLPFAVEAKADHSLLGIVKNAVGAEALNRYTLFVQKQSGVLTRTTHVHLTLPENMRQVWSSDDALIENGAISDGRTDGYFAELIEAN